MSEAAKSERGEQSRLAIAAAAQELFLERGYDKTTMRAVAERAGVSLGNAYYYFSSKEHLVQAFYDGIQASHAEVAVRRLDGRVALGDRLGAALIAWIDVAEPFHEFAAQFFKVAADPGSPLSPFSPESAPARDAAVGIHRLVVEGSDAKVTKDVRAALPELLWMLQMGIVLFWVHDQSEGQARTRELVQRLVPVVDKVVKVSRLPGVKGVITDLIDLLDAMRP
ncbi:TetR family transcriptional regulator [Knoellia sinensis KCTC 19936]|uniref:TetR family transcriptional regulator n=1 Tax=Knoellia sinensis KCTC 19936 TaxID=1385520 RepID=A0A0A0J7V0_9MICO|nr:TetR family transcriptional regulator [Knoellia sinensis]KGN31696.1 TetR family transcriptional regulator [Knoellia sinensis KCTC 19936]